MEDQWIKVIDDLPDYDEFVLWFREDGNMFVSELDKDGNHWLYPMIKGQRPTHWMRLPEPPKTDNP